MPAAPAKQVSEFQSVCPPKASWLPNKGTSARPDKQLRTRVHQFHDAAKGHDRLWHGADIKLRPLFGRFSNRPFGVKLLQAIHRCSVDVAHRLVLLFGIGTKALPSWDSKTRWNNLWGGLAVRRTAGPSDRTNSPHPSSREGHRSTARWSSSFLLLHLILYGRHAVAACRVHRNSVPSTHMRCMITASRRARATIAFFIPRRLAICIAQALSQDHFFDRSML